MDATKDIVTTILGASVGLAGLLLVFSGFLFAQAESFPRATTDNAIINKFKKAGRFGLIPFLLALLLAGMSIVWLLWPDPCLFLLSWTGFIVLLLGTALYGSIVIYYYL